MGVTAYLLGFVSIVLALALAELLRGVARVLRAGGIRRLPLEHSLFVLLVFLLVVDYWWTMWAWNPLRSWPVTGFLSTLLGMAMLFLVATLALPGRAAEAEMESWFRDTSGRLWTLLAIFAIAVVLTNLLVLRPGAPAVHLVLGVGMIPVAVCIVLSRLPHPRIQQLGTSFLLITTLANLLTRQPTISG
jgi:hypothetical protein